MSHDGAARRPTANAIPPAIDWREGMLLAPQHFQLAAHRTEALLHYHGSAVSPFHWGLIEYDRKKLVDGVLEITAVEALFPDGLVVAHPRRDGGGARDLRIDLKPHIAAIEAGANTVFLFTAAREPGEGFTQRYENFALQTTDETTALDDLPIDVLHPKLQLKAGDQLTNDLVGFPIARVSVRGGAIEESNDFEAPWLRVRRGSRVHELCVRVADRLRADAVDLAASVAHESASARGSQLLETRMLIHSLVSSLPLLEVLLRSEAAHPYQLYLALASVLGNLAPGLVPKRIDAYDHDDPLRVFRKLEDAIGETIQQAVHSPYTTYPFNATPEGFRLFIEQSWFQRPLMLGVRAPSGMKPNDVDKWVTESVIGAEPKINELRLHRMSGLKRERPEESEVLPASGDIFYELKAPYHGYLQPLQNLVISNADPQGRPDQIVLYVKQRGQNRVPDEQVS